MHDWPGREELTAIDCVPPVQPHVPGVVELHLDDVQLK